jgi:hypothetical protein
MGVIFSNDDQTASKGKEEFRMVKLRLGNQLTNQEQRQVKHTFDRLQDAGVRLTLNLPNHTIAAALLAISNAHCGAISANSNFYPLV